jgi:hypothetical protein
MISHKHKCIFIHIPKAAGTSIESFFLDDLGLNFEDKHSLIIGKSTNLYIEPPVVSHLSATQMLSQFYISEELYNDYFKFSITRNPIDRLFSTYKYWGFESVITFDTFIKKLLHKLMKQRKTSFFLKTQTEYLYDESKENNSMDFTGKFECLNNDFKEIVSRLIIPYSELSHKNQGKSQMSILRGIKKVIENPELLRYINLRKKKKRTLSKESLLIINEIYAADFNNFNYEIIHNT